MLSIISGGTIPDRGLYAVYLGGMGGARVGELDEEMVHETQPGHVITLGASSWRVQEITRDSVDRAMVENINDIGHVLGIRTIAESVEDVQTLELLREIGVDYAQCYHVHMPEPVHGEEALPVSAAREAS